MFFKLATGAFKIESNC